MWRKVILQEEERQSKNKPALISRYLFLGTRLEGVTTLKTTFHSSQSGACGQPCQRLPWSIPKISLSNWSLSQTHPLLHADTVSGYNRMHLHLSTSLQTRCVISPSDTVAGIVIWAPAVSWGSWAIDCPELWETGQPRDNWRNRSYYWNNCTFVFQHCTVFFSGAKTGF